jgi:HPt (histidine-containing phosphotransfer) domain-containing protein
MTTLQLEALQSIRELAGDTPGLLEQIVQLYFDSAPPLIAQLKTGFTANDLNAIRLASHSLKSSSANLGAMVLAQMCGKIEAAARAGTFVADIPTPDAVEAEYERVVHALRAEIGEPLLD